MSQLAYNVYSSDPGRSFTADILLDVTPLFPGGSTYQVVGASGNVNGVPITDVGTTGSNLIYTAGYDGTLGQVDEQGFSFVSDGGTYRIFGQYYPNAAGRKTFFFYSETGPNTSASQPVIGVTFNAVPVCFVTGARIRTARGEVAVEDLVVGDFAVTASGALRPITWIGRREIKAESGALAFNQQPVRIRAGAFSPGLPVRDLFLSPGHPVLVAADSDNAGGVLVPVMCLINGTSISREPVSSVTYWHIELDAHDILLAEGLPAESYIDGGDRAFFTEASDHALHNPDFVALGWDGRCRPVAIDGAVVEAERLRLDAVFAVSLSHQCGWPEEFAAW